MSGLVSVIVPVYNVAAYLEQCLESICTQSYANLEIIVVDDGSTDESRKVADQFALTDSRVKVFHTANSGAAAARNYALNHATGEYYTFIDSDDWVEHNYIATMLQYLNNFKVDIVQFNYWDEYVGEGHEHILFDDNILLNTHDYVKHMLENWEDLLIWNKVFRKECISQIRFSEGHCIDDEFYTYKVILNAESLLGVKDVVYHYRMRSSGAMRSIEKKKQRLEDKLEFVDERYPRLVKEFPDLKICILEHLLFVYFTVLQDPDYDKKSYYKSKKKLLSYGYEYIKSPQGKTDYKKNVIKYLLLKQNYWFKRALAKTENGQTNNVLKLYD